MRLCVTVSAAALFALGINAAAIAAPLKSFKFLVEDPVKGSFFLADASGAGTQNASQALLCQLSADIIRCDGNGFPEFTEDDDMVQLSTSGNSTGWSIDSNNTIQWNAVPDLKFSVGVYEETDLWAEVCPHHDFGHGIAKAVFV